MAWLLVLCLLPLGILAQDPADGGNKSNIPSSLLPGGQLPTLQQRMQQLPIPQTSGSGSGVDPAMDPFSGLRPGNMQPLQPNAGSQFPAPQRPGDDSQSQQSDIELEGDEEVLPDDQAGYESKPQEINEVNLNPDIAENVFGHHLFDGDQSDFFVADLPSPPDGYIVGPGDVFSVTVYGPSELFETLTVAEDGSVLRQYIGKVYVGGMTLGKAREILSQRYRSIVSNRATIEIRLTGDRRSISVNIVGEVRRPGNYRINAAVPAFNALFEAGGINEIGTVRKIQIERDGKIVQILDLYAYLLEGKNQPIFLQNNDFIHVPVQNKVVDLSGAVKRPMAYELKMGENLKSLIYFAGGLKFDAMTSKAQIARLENGREVLVDFPLSEILANQRKDYNLGSGDRVIIQNLNMGAYNIVQIYGDVEYPGTYQLQPGERLSDIIARAGGLGINSYLKRAYVVRVVPGANEVLYVPLDLTGLYNIERELDNPDDVNNIELQYFDAIQVFSQDDLRDQRYIEVEGEVRNPGTFQTFPSMTVKDLLYLVGGPKEDADLNNLELSIITRAENYYIPRDEDQQGSAQADNGDMSEMESGVDAADQLGTDAAEGQAPEADGGFNPEVVRRISVSTNWEDDPTLDTMLVYGFDRFQVYSKYDFLSIRYLEVEGSVRKPGFYQLQRGMTLKDVFYLSGGLTDSADINEIELYHDIPLQERGNFNTSSDRQELIRVEIEGKDWQSSSVADSIMMDDYYKVVVRSGKDFFEPGFVEVKGLVNSPGKYKMAPNMTAKDLIYMADGLKVEADFERIELSRVVEVLSGTGEVVPVPIVISTIRVAQNWQEDSTLDRIKVNAFDQMIVRKNPDFDLQESVFVKGEVLVAGEYHKAKRNESLSSFVARAGGVTELAYLEGASIKRPNIGSIALKLHRALRRPGSRFDIPLLEGDTLYIPPRVDVVTITGNVLRPGVKVLFEKRKRNFKYYVNLAGGFARRTKKRHSTVTYADGTVRSVRGFLFFHKYPKIEQGALIEIAAKPPKGDGNIIDSFKVNVQETLAGATSILTFLFLLDRTVLDGNPNTN
jgi:protein involved in polysaccharide export with SLBB domain